MWLRATAATSKLVDVSAEPVLGSPLDLWLHMQYRHYDQLRTHSTLQPLINLLGNSIPLSFSRYHAPLQQPNPAPTRKGASTWLYLSLETLCTLLRFTRDSYWEPQPNVMHWWIRPQKWNEGYAATNLSSDVEYGPPPGVNPAQKEELTVLPKACQLPKEQRQTYTPRGGMPLV